MVSVIQNSWSWPNISGVFIFEKESKEHSVMFYEPKILVHSP
jgi:hypothetical protein